MQKQASWDQYATDNSTCEQKQSKPCLNLQNIDNLNFDGKTKRQQSQNQQETKISVQIFHPQDLNDGSKVICESLDLLQQHEVVLGQLLSNCQSIFNQSSISNKNKTQSGSVIFKSITLEHYFFILLKELRQIKPQLVALFTSYVQREKNCRRFLQHVYYSYPAHVVHHIFKYLFFMWQLYYPNAQSNLSVQAKICLSQKIFTKIYKNELKSAKYLNIVNDQIKGKLRRLIGVLTITFVLVMEKCFINPYFAQMSHKRQFDAQSDDELAKISSTRKLLKREEGGTEQ